MKKTIEAHIFTFYLPMTGVSLFIQLSLAGYIIWLNWEVMAFTIWSDQENREYFDRNIGNHRETDEMRDQRDTLLTQNEAYELPQLQSHRFSVSLDGQVL